MMPRLALAAALGACLAAPAWAEVGGCGPRAMLVRALAQGDLQSVIATGWSKDGLAIEIWVTADGTRWTALATGRDGIACVLTVGRDWLPIDLKREGRDG